MINALLGRPTWTYNTTQAGPVRGPLPKLSYGSEPVNNEGDKGEGIPAQPFSYSPRFQDEFNQPLPRTISTGEDGRSLVGTYQPHDVTIGQRFATVWRSVPAWQNGEFPDTRELTRAQQVMKYNVTSYTRAHRPLDSSQYFLGYTTDPAVAASIGQSGTGYMGG